MENTQDTQTNFNEIWNRIVIEYNKNYNDLWNNIDIQIVSEYDAVWNGIHVYVINDENQSSNMVSNLPLEETSLDVLLRDERNQIFIKHLYNYLITHQVKINAHDPDDIINLMRIKNSPSKNFTEDKMNYIETVAKYTVDRLKMVSK
jgi:hypothetical protein